MPSNHSFYSVSTFDTLHQGEKIKIEHYVSVVRGKADISELVPLPISVLEQRRADSVKAEKAIFEQLCASVSKWEEQAALTTLLNRAIEYCKTPDCLHSSNKWIENENGGQNVSNMVYKMSYYVYEETKYDRDKRASVPVAWQLTWEVCTNTTSTNRLISSQKIAGQERKRFTDKAAMEKYLQGRIKAYSNLFTELSPPVPQELAKHFMVNDMLLPGYTVDKNNPVQVEQTVHNEKHLNSDKPSVLGKIAEAREEQKHSKPKDNKSLTPNKSKSQEAEH